MVKNLLHMILIVVVQTKVVKYEDEICTQVDLSDKKVGDKNIYARYTDSESASCLGGELINDPNVPGAKFCLPENICPIGTHYCEFCLDEKNPTLVEVKSEPCALGYLVFRPFGKCELNLLVKKSTLHPGMGYCDSKYQYAYNSRGSMYFPLQDVNIHTCTVDTSRCAPNGSKPDGSCLLCHGADMRGESDNFTCKPSSEDTSTTPVPINGGFSDWGLWSECMKGEQTRNRSCTNPVPLHEGKNCTGMFEEERECSDTTPVIAENDDKTNKKEETQHSYGWIIAICSISVVLFVGVAVFSRHRNRHTEITNIFKTGNTKNVIQQQHNYNPVPDNGEAPVNVPSDDDE